MKNLVLLLIVGLMASCTPEPIDIELPQAPSKIVVSSQYAYDTISQQNVLLVVLTKSFSALENNLPVIDSTGIHINPDLLVSGATVEVITPQETITLTEGDQGMYYAVNFSYVPNQLVKLVVKDAQNNVLTEATTGTTQTKDFEYVGLQQKGANKFLNYAIKDDPNISNWYLVNYFTKQQKDSVPNYNDPRYIAKKLTEQDVSFDIYSDADFVNGTLTVEKNLGVYNYDTVVVAISEVTQSHYQFLTAQKRYGKFINQLRGEIINFPTNVKNGYGYFSANNPKVRILTFN